MGIWRNTLHFVKVELSSGCRAICIAQRLIVHNSVPYDPPAFGLRPGENTIKIHEI